MTPSFVGRALSPEVTFIYVFAVTVLIQAFHMVEHIAQVTQKFVLDMSSAHGLMGQLDLEQVHFAFNLIYWASLMAVMAGWLYFGDRMCDKHRALGVLLAGTVIAQSYHMVEHSVKLAQFISTGVQGTPGIAGTHFDGVIFHALMNTAVFLPPLFVFFCAGLHHRLLGDRRIPS